MIVKRKREEGTDNHGNSLEVCGILLSTTKNDGEFASAYSLPMEYQRGNFEWGRVRFIVGPNFADWYLLLHHLFVVNGDHMAYAICRPQI